MHNLFQTSGKTNLVDRLEKLSVFSQRQWGTMTVEEMFWHLRSQLELALGIREQRTHVKSVLRVPPLRWLALYVFPWPKGSPTAPEMHVRKSNPAVASFEQEKQLLLQRLTQVEQATSLGPHPLFGAMSKPLWGRLIWKHVDHHLRQFGA